MDLKQLAYFTAVVDEGTISAAARKLHITQPPLSSQLKLLEKEAGCLLFERGSRSIRLTDAGRMMYERASALLHMSDLLKEELKGYRLGSHGTLRLGVVSSVGGTLFSGWLKGFHEAHPHIRFEIFEANTYQLLEKLQDGLIELAVVRTPFPPGELQCVPLKKEPILAAGRRSFFEAPKAPSISLEELSRLPLILYRRWESVLSEAFRKRGLELAPFCKNDSASTTAFWADAGLGVGILPASSAPLLRDPDTICLPIADAGLVSEISLIRVRGAYLSESARAFMEYLQGPAEP